jgi:DNA-binding Lrp family transcriptional regulator
MSTDPLDMRIIRALQQNSRKPVIELAKEVGANEATVRRRIEKLVEMGIIKRFTVVLDYHKLGRVIKAFIGLRVQPPKLREIIDHLSKNEDVQVLYRTSGDMDIFIEVIFEDMESLNAFLEKELKLEGITGTIVTVVIGPYKHCPWTGL